MGVRSNEAGSAPTGRGTPGGPSKASDMGDVAGRFLTFLSSLPGGESGLVIPRAGGPSGRRVQRAGGPSRSPLWLNIPQTKSAISWVRNPE